MVKDLGIDPDTFRKQSPLFDMLDPQGRERLMEAAEEVHFAPGQPIVEEGDPGDSLFVIREGVVRVAIDALEGSKTVARLGPGSVFGEMAVVTGQLRSATVTAEQAVVAWRFDKSAIDAILADYPRVHELLARLGVKRSEMTLEKMLSSDLPIPSDD